MKQNIMTAAWFPFGNLLCASTGLVYHMAVWTCILKTETGMLVWISTIGKQTLFIFKLSLQLCLRHVTHNVICWLIQCLKDEIKYFKQSKVNILDNHCHIWEVLDGTSCTASFTLCYSSGGLLGKESMPSPFLNLKYL